jgi:DNA-binding transcriptional LysR family regulator
MDDVLAHGFDAGARFGEDLALDMIGVPLGSLKKMAVVASSAHVERHGRPKTPKDLLRNSLIGHRFSDDGVDSFSQTASVICIVIA